MAEKLSYYQIVPHRQIEETHIWSDNDLVVSYDDEKITLRVISERFDDPCTYTLYRTKQPLVERIRLAYERDLKNLMEEIEEFKNQYGGENN